MLKRSLKRMWKELAMRSKALILAGLAAVSFATAASADFDPQLLRRAYAEITPAMGLLTYASEITNPASGEVTRRDGNGLALVVTPGGLVMCHGHMKLENSEPFNISVTLGEGADEKKYDAEFVGKPDDVNVVFLQLKSDTPLDLPHIKFAGSSSLELADPITLFGLLGESLDFEAGMQGARIGAVLDKPRTTYCIDGSVRFGFVTGPAIDTQGRVVGVVGFDMTGAEGGDLYVRSGHPLIYQVELFSKYLTEPPRGDGEPASDGNAWLGVFTQPLTDDFAAYWGLDPRGGLIVSTVVPGSPAQQGGLQQGDIIVSFDETPVRAKADRDVMGFTKLVRETGPGKQVAVRVLRGGEPAEVTVTLGEQPRSAQDAEEYEDEVLGLTVRELTQDLRIRLNLSEDVQGVIVRRVKSGSTAQLGKMQAGVIVLAIGDAPVRNLEDYRAAVAALQEAKPAEVAVFARFGSETGFFRLEPIW